MDQRNKVMEVRGLKKCYGEKKVVDQLSFCINSGDILGFLGPNGAGKSTTIRLMTGIEKMDGGKVLFDGKEAFSDIRRMQRQLGVVPQEISFYMDLCAYDNVAYFCSLYGFKGEERKERVKEALEFAGLWEYRKQKPGNFSGGMKRRLNIACSISHSPKLLIMDEPTVGIDPQSRNHIMETIKKLNKRGTTVIYVSHYMEEIEALCNRIIILDHGSILKDCGKEELKMQYEKQGVTTLEDIFLAVTGTSLRDGE